MGSDESVPKQRRGSYSCLDESLPKQRRASYSHLDTGDTTTYLSGVQRLGCLDVRQRIVDAGFSAVWSMKATRGTSPLGRGSQFCAVFPERNVAIAGYGMDKNDNCLNDIWQLNLDNLRWSKVPVDTGSVTPRSGTTAVKYENKVCLFGGFNGRCYVEDFHVLNLDTLQITRPKLKGNGPSARIGHVMASHGSQILIWGGYNGDWLSDLWLLDTGTGEWREIPTRVRGRTSTAWANHGDYLYIYGSAATDPLLKYDWTKETLEIVKATGTEPASEISQASMVAVDRFLLLFGGRLDGQKHCLLYGFDTVKKWWFVFNFVPDGRTTTLADGIVDDSGHFQVPRIRGASIVYRQHKRDVILFLGLPILEPSNIGIVKIGGALGVLHQQFDMLDMADC